MRELVLCNVISRKMVWVVMLAGLLLVSPAMSQSGGPYELSWSTIDGGGESSAGGPYVLTGTIGQPDADLASGGIYELLGGFWPYVIGTKYHPADTLNDYVISMLEILGYIDKWAIGNVSMLEVLEGIDLWAAGQYYWDPVDGKFKPGEQP